MIGVVTGVFLIVSLLSLSEGIKEAILQQMRMMGKDLIIVIPGDISDFATVFAGGMDLTDDDIKAIKKSDGAESVVPFDYKAEIARYEGKKKTILLNGIPWSGGRSMLEKDMGWALKEGRWPVPGKKEIIAGSMAPEDIFPGLKSGEKVVINGIKFEVVGILRSLGSKQDDTNFNVDLEIFRDITGQRKGAKMVLVKSSADYSVDQAAKNIKDNLEKSRKRIQGEDSQSFSVLTSEKVVGIVGNIMGLVQAAVVGFASIAIVVGGIGIMNTMYTSVHERIKEIGIMKAVGAKNKMITNIFLVESGFFGLFGGAGGVLFGLALAKVIEIYFQIHPFLYLRAAVTPQLILFCLLFSFLVGCVSGYLPARSAAKLKPVDALRYE